MSQENSLATDGLQRTFQPDGQRLTPLRMEKVCSAAEKNVQCVLKSRIRPWNQEQS